MEDNNIGSKGGEFLLSFDFELGWGCAESGYWRQREKNRVYDDLRNTLPRLLSILDSLQLPVTWAIVGAMCQPSVKRDFSHLPHAAREIVEGFSNESVSTSNDGCDLLDLVRNSDVDHKIACHSYSHTRFNFPGYDESTAKGEVDRFNEVCDSLEMSVDSLVCPQNIVDHLDAYARVGYRRVRTSPAMQQKSKLSKLIQPPPYSRLIENSSGIVQENGSILFSTARDKYILMPLISFKTKKLIRASIRDGERVHLWLHPFNLVNTPGVFEKLVSVLNFVAHSRDIGSLDVKTF